MCQETYNYEDQRGGGISVGLGSNHCPAVMLYHPTGYTAVVSLTIQIFIPKLFSVVALECHPEDELSKIQLELSVDGLMVALQD